ncbi:HAD hydrolase-like protein [aff. Roholtiella sp. LEGE 12411]|uniref:HAD hydrolase-like protein n=1 Tax=aff. Roholtiella sp. LEGE 12411 TaxID=1828822 RepID=UPI0018805339|nr:HAD hydrolase-like protein [aff. Roholtiella sp. LEGE 12411]MBE9036028.1 HAD hydrolase-like protein [aff. Roholtiella sp. LEGE 12411]
MNKILFLDLDGTARQPKSGATFINKPLDQEIIPGVAEAIARYPNHVLIGITNQGGVAAGKKSLEDAIAEQQYTIQLLPQLLEIYFCPDFDGRQCYKLTCVDGGVTNDAINFEENDLKRWQGQCRKPNCGMVEIAIAEMSLKVDRKESLFVGDRAEDQACAAGAGIPFMWAADWRGECD